VQNPLNLLLNLPLAFPFVGPTIQSVPFSSIKYQHGEDQESPGPGNFGSNLRASSSAQTIARMALNEYRHAPKSIACFSASCITSTAISVNTKQPHRVD
jgi:hypothetical protein